MKTKKKEDIKGIILSEYKKGNIVVSTFEGLKVMPLDEFVKQPVEGMLYDLNRDELVILTFINDPKWINDFASTKVIRKLALIAEKRDEIIESQGELDKFIAKCLLSGTSSMFSSFDVSLVNKEHELRQKIETLKKEIQ